MSDLTSFADLLRRLEPIVKTWITSGSSSASSTGYLAPSPHDIFSIHHTGTDLVLRSDGATALTGDLTVNAGITIDGRDLSVDGAALDALGLTVTNHILDPNAHHAAVTLLSADVGLTLTGQVLSVHLAANSGLKFATGLSIDKAATFAWSALHTFNGGIEIASGQNLNLGTDCQIGRKSANLITLGPGDALQSYSYVAGASGWYLSDDVAEFGNVRVRGSIQASVFEKSVTTAFAGSLVVAKSAAKLSTNWVVDSGTPPFTNTAHLIVESPSDGSWAFATGDIIELKALYGAAFAPSGWADEIARGLGQTPLSITSGAGDTWGIVTRTATLNEYTVAIQVTSTVNVVYPAGTGIVDWGASGQGFFAVSADGSYGASAAWVLGTHAGAPWSTKTIEVYAGSDGKLYAGGGAISLGSSGATVICPYDGGPSSSASYKFSANGVLFGYLNGYYGSDIYRNEWHNSVAAGKSAYTAIESFVTSSSGMRARIDVQATPTDSRILLRADYLEIGRYGSTGSITIDPSAGTLSLAGGLNVGTATGATAGQIKTSGTLVVGGASGTIGGSAIVTADNIGTYITGGTFTAIAKNTVMSANTQNDTSASYTSTDYGVPSGATAIVYGYGISGSTGGYVSIERSNGAADSVIVGDMSGIGICPLSSNTFRARWNGQHALTLWIIGYFK